MSNLYYKTKNITVENYTLVKSESDVYTSLSIINNSDEDVLVYESETGDVFDSSTVAEGTILGSKKMLTYDNPPKNAVFICKTVLTIVNVLIKYSE